jgi:CHAT domain-containing protein
LLALRAGKELENRPMKRCIPLVVLGIALACAGTAPAQNEMKDFFRKQDERMKGILKKRDADLARIKREWQEEVDRLRPFWLMYEAELLKGENQFQAAIEKAKQSTARFESKRPEQLTPAEAITYREALLQLGRLYAAAGEAEQAEQAARRAWKIDEVMRASARPGSRPDERDQMRTALAVGMILLAAEQLDETARFVQRVFDIGRTMREPFNRPEHNPLLVEALLLRSMLANQAGNFPAAFDDAKEVLPLLRRQYPRTTHPHGDVKLALGLYNLAMAHVALGQMGAALSLLFEADEMLSHHSPQGDLLRAEVQRILGQLYLQRGEDRPAIASINRARMTYERIFPEKLYSHSHPMLIQGLLSLADLLDRFRHREAVPYAQRAWKECQRRYAQQPHEQMIAALLTYGRCLRDAGQPEPAQQRFTEAVDLAGRIGKDRPSPAHDSLQALCQLHLGSLLGRQGRYPEARKLFQDARTTYQKLAPDGHPLLFATAAYQGILAAYQGDRAGASAAFADALRLDQKQLRGFAHAAAEVEVLTFAQPRQLALEGYLATSQNEKDADEQAYRLVWASKNAVTRLAQARRAAVRLARERGDSEARRTLAALVDAYARLRQGQTTARDRTSLPNLLKEIDRLELDLGRYWPDAERSFRESSEQGPDDLAARLPVGSAFLDFVQYHDLTEKRSLPSRYVAFLVLPGQRPKRIELGLARDIDKAVNGWRRCVDAWNPLAPAPVRRNSEVESLDHIKALRRDVWEPIVPHLPAGTQRLVLALDGDLARFPFAALPGSRPRSILLEDFSIAYVPHGPFLLSRLRASQERPQGLDRFLAVGGVAYGPPEGVPGRAFRDLPGTRRVIELAKRRAALQDTRILSDREATVKRLLDELREASEGHVSTHGFFDEAALNAERKEQARMIRDWSPRLETPVGHVGLGKRFPLSFVGLALAGANEPGTPDGGILTGEAIPSLSLLHLWLIILDACETGLGEYTAGEGVQGLQLAFHIAGCPNIIATLWHVDDLASQALMEEFYHQRWGKRLPTLEALRQAQLTLHGGPGRTPRGGQRRGAPQEDAWQGREIHLPLVPDTDEGTHPMLWGAAYVHSGIGDRFLDALEIAETSGGPEDAESQQAATDSSHGFLPVLALGGLLTLALFAVMLIRRHRPKIHA